MYAPSLALVPPTPTYYSSSSSSNSPNSSPAISFSSTATSTSVTRLPPEKAERSSSDSAIVSIYSMYGDEPQNRASWGSGMMTDAPQIKLDYRKSLLKKNGNLESELAYFEEDSQIIDLTDPASAAVQADAFKLSNYDYATSPAAVQRTSFRDSRPLSNYNSPSEYNEHRRASTAQSYRTTITSTTSAPLTTSRSEESSYSPSRYSRVSASPQRKSAASNGELPSIPRSITPLGTPPARTSELLEVPAPTVPPASSSKPLPLKHPVYVGSPASKTSLVPSEGEDLDAFHVRNTYAQLDISGVKGDGYEEGVERTRARVGDSRASQLHAEAALGDGTEKTRELDQKELELLASVDRYGFFTVPSHDRLVLLPTTPLLRRLSPISAGPPNAPTSGTSLTSLPPPPPPLKETSRIGKWERMLRPQKPDPGGAAQAWYVRPSKEAKLRERTYKGIPDRWRPVAWEVLMSRFTSQHTDPKNQLSLSMNQLAKDYREVLDKPSTYDIQIDLDVPRTISGHVMFRTRYGAGQRSLFHVLHSFSQRCEECGYVQGMGPIAATLLCYFTPEQVYSALVRLHDVYAMHTIFSPGFPGLLEAIYVQERITEQMLPAVYNAFRKHMISTTSYATKWYITLFSNSVPFQTQLRLWDVFLLEGQDVFVAVAVAIIWVFRDQITSATANFETVLSLLSSFFVPEDENVFLGWIERTLTDKKLRSSMNQWRHDWRELVSAGKDGDALI